MSNTAAPGRLPKLSPTDISHDVDMMLWAFKLQRIRRWMRQPYWQQESLDAEYADKLEDFPRLETVAEHSWNVADSVILLAPSFPYLHRERAVELAILHDKMEIEIGDINPLGRDGTGKKGHAFNGNKQLDKHRRELKAIEGYVRRLRENTARLHRSLLLEGLECRTPEARFVKSIDKMQALAFILLKKGGAVEDKHLTFLVEFTEKNDRYFPPLTGHSQELLRRIFRAAARRQDTTSAALLKKVAPRAVQLTLPFDHGTSDGENFQETSARTKSSRLAMALEEVGRRMPARTSLEAYRQISDAINRVEDMHWGADYWEPPRHVDPGARTARLYPIAPESIYPVRNYGGVDVLVSVTEYVFVSRFGAIEVQTKDRDDSYGKFNAFCGRRDRVVFEKHDYAGNGVWHEKNK